MIDEKILELSVSAFMHEMIEEGKSLFAGMLSEGKQFFEKDLKSYLSKQKNRYSYMKTLLRGNNPIFIYDIYYNLNIFKVSHTRKLNNNRIIGKKGRVQEEEISTSDIKNLFINSNNITIIGDAGSGKSTLVKHLFLNSILTKYSIPILIELRYLNSNDSALHDYICDKIVEDKVSQNSNILEKLLESGKFVFFLDGYDELNSSRKKQFRKR